MSLEVLRVSESPSQGTPLLFVHGAWHGAWCWQEHFLPWFSSRGWSCIAPSLRGHAGSPGFSRWLSIQDYVQDVQSVMKTIQTPPILDSWLRSVHPVL
ncbi:MAG: alpha/beta fold hydrolase [Myxococcota bacterium]